jgi:hypothetical protein
MLEELRPPPALAVGLTGHRNIAMDGSVAEATERSVGAVLEGASARADTGYRPRGGIFLHPAPIVRLITMGAEGADLLGARAARKCGMEIAYILPFVWDEYRSDFSRRGDADGLAVAVTLRVSPRGRRHPVPSSQS